MVLDLSRNTILIVEDDEINFKYLEVVLSRKTNINILWANNGLKAVNIMKDFPKVDLILMDIQLPVLNGFEATNEIREFSDVPIVFQTANDIRRYDEEPAMLKINEVIRKPISMDVLVNTVINNVKSLPIHN